MRISKLIVIFLLLVILSPSCVPQSIFFKEQARLPVQIDTNADDLNMNLFDGFQIKLAIHTLKDDRSHTVSIKKITVKEFRTMTNRINERISSDKDYDTLFENVLQILKEYTLIDQDITLQEIFDRNISTQFNTTNFTRIYNEPFMSIFSPIFIAGMGAGAALGDTFGLVSGNVYSFGVLGLGSVVCIDLLLATIYSQFTFTLPLLIHILSGFAGIMMFPVHFDKLYASGFPLTIYSNFIALGVAGLAVGLMIPYTNYTKKIL